MALEALRAFCEKSGFATTNIAAFTFQKGRSTNFCSVIVDWENNTLLPHYPIALLETVSEGSGVTYEERRLPGNVLLCFKTDLPRPAAAATSASDKTDFPCCSAIQPYRDRRLDKEIYFTNFKQGVGSHEDVVFEVKRQVDNGPLLDTTYYELRDGTRRVVEGKFTEKIHAFKNYKCTSCNLFFSVDLYSQKGVSKNFHHMRLNPFTKNVESLCDFLP